MAVKPRALGHSGQKLKYKPFQTESCEAKASPTMGVIQGLE